MKDALVACELPQLLHQGPPGVLICPIAFNMEASEAERGCANDSGH